MCNLNTILLMCMVCIRIQKYCNTVCIVFGAGMNRLLCVTIQQMAVMPDDDFTTGCKTGTGSANL